MAHPEIDNAVAALVPIVHPVVVAIEQSVPTTQHHYGEYMAAISKLAEIAGFKSQASYLAIGLAMQKAGGSKDGIKAALRVMGHL